MGAAISSHNATQRQVRLPELVNHFVASVNNLKMKLTEL